MIHIHYYSFVISITVAAIICFGNSYGHGLRYWVGDTVWSIPPYPNLYNDWSSSHLFHIGDSLVFDFETELYNLMQVTALDYQSCKPNNPIKLLNPGPATILLNQQGVFYYLCNLSNYCDLGQKISIIVHDNNFPPAPTPSPARESPLTPLFAPFLSPEPSTDDRNSSESPMTAPVSSQPPSLTPADLGHTTSSCGKLERFRGCFPVSSFAVFYFLW